MNITLKKELLYSLLYLKFIGILRLLMGLLELLLFLIEKVSKFLLKKFLMK